MINWKGKFGVGGWSIQVRFNKEDNYILFWCDDETGKWLSIAVAAVAVSLCIAYFVRVWHLSIKRKINNQS